MNKQTFVAPNPSDLVLKESFHGKKKSGQSREFQPETCSDDADRSQPLHSKISSHFDYSNLGLFFGGIPSQVKPSTEGIIGKLHSKKKSNETCSSKEGTLKHASSKDYSNLDELFENTTIISNPSETKPHTKRRSNDISLNKGSNDDANDLAQANFLETLLFKHHNKKKSSKNSFSSLLKAQREDRLDDEIAQDINKLGLDINPDEQDKGDFGYLKAPKSNLKVLELIKNKALPNRPVYSETPKSTSQIESHVNFTGKKVTQAMSPLILSYQDQDIYNDDNAAQDKFINELFENPKENSEDIPLDKSKEISHEDLNPRLLTERTTNKHMRKVANLNLDSSRDNRTKPNLSLMSTESTVDSENLANQQDHHNNSFSTPFSGASGSFNNSGKLDFSSPARLDSGRIHSENSEMGYMGGGYPNPNMMNGRMPVMPSLQRVPMNLNQSCMSFHGGYGSGNNSDRSANLSFNEEYINNAFTSSFNTPQNHPQPFLNNNFNNMSSNPNIMEQFFIAPQNLNNQFNMMGQTQSSQERTSLTSGKLNTTNPNVNDSKNPSRMRRKTHEAEDGKLYEIDIDTVEQCGRTTVMIRNIPNKYDLPLITQTIEKNHKGKYDFFYLPIDFSNRCNFGYAFINFSNPKFIKDFYLEFNGKKWEKFNSEKICEIKYARIQGYNALMQHFQYSRVMNQQDKKLRPYIPPNKYGLPNKHKIEELVRQQKLESANNGREMDTRRGNNNKYY